MALGGLKGTLVLTGASVGATNALTGSVSVAVGDLVFVAFAQQTALTASGVTDNLGNSYGAVNAGTDAGVVTGRAFYSRVTAAGTLTTVTVAATSSTNDFAGNAAVIEGPVPVSPLNANPANGSNDTASPFTCPATGTLNMSHQLVLCCVMHDNNVSLAATSPNLLAGQANRNNAAVAIGYQLVAATSTISPEFTGTNPAANVLITASFRADLLPSLYTDGDSFFTPIVLATYGLVAPLFTDGDTFNAHTLVSTYPLTAELFTDGDSFFEPTVTPGAVALLPSLSTNDNSFPSATVLPGPVGLTPDRFDNGNTFHSATVSAGYPLAATLYSNEQTFFSPTVEQSGGTAELLPELFSDGETFFSPTVAPGPVDLAPALFSDGDSFPSAAVTPGPVSLAASLFIDDDTFFTANVGQAGTQDLLPDLLLNDAVWFAPTIANSADYHLTGAGMATVFRDIRRRQKQSRKIIAPRRLDNYPIFFSPLVIAMPPRPEEFDKVEVAGDLFAISALMDMTWTY